LALGGIDSDGKGIQQCTVFAAVWKFRPSDISHVHALREAGKRWKLWVALTVSSGRAIQLYVPP